MDEKDIIHWDSIKNGYIGFEELANEFVVKEIGFNSNWKPTQLTRDGNKDGFAILCCYSPISGIREEQIWMEAKYSTTQKTLSRYKLDSTIVSAIIEGNVKEIIFITNVEIDISVEQKIRKALINALNYKTNNVAFYSKWALEKWLILNPQIYSKYFNIKLNNVIHRLDAIYCTENIEFFEKTYNLQFFTEPLRKLNVGQIYSSYLRIYSSIPQILPIIPLIEYLTIKNNHCFFDGQISLSKGMNSIELDIEFIKECQIGGPILQIGDSIEIKTKNLINISKKIQPITIYIKSQNYIYEEILKSLIEQSNNDGFLFHNIIGAGGTGKTHLLENILKSEQIYGKDVIIATFTEDQFENNRLLLNVVLSILFYYLDISIIDNNYLNDLRKNNYFISTYLEKLVSLKNENDSLYNAFTKYKINENILFPPKAKLNFKVILLDDVHKLDDNNRFFLNKMLVELNKTTINGIVIQLGREYYFSSDEFLFFRKNCVSFLYELEVTIDDILQSLKFNNIRTNELASRVILNHHQFNCLLLVQFIRYLKSKNEIIDDANFIFLYQKFVNSDLFQKFILDSFKGIVRNRHIQTLLNAIYFSSTGVFPQDLKANHRAVLNELFDYELVRSDPNGKIVPFHDYYTKIFRDYYQNEFKEYFQESNYLFSEIEQLRYTLLIGLNPSKTSQIRIANKIKQLSRDYCFFSVIYILEPLFENKIKDNIRYRFDEVCYYELYFIYLFATAHTSKYTSVLDKRKKILNEIINNSNYELRLIAIKFLGEILNSSFENLSLEDVDKYANQLEGILTSLNEYGYLNNKLEYNGSYILMKEVCMLKEMLLDNYEEGEKLFNLLKNICFEKNSLSKLGIIKIRFARSLYHKDISRAISLLEEGIDDRLKSRKGKEDDKWVLIGRFELIFLKINREQATIKDLRLAHDKLKENLFNDYRRAINEVAAHYILKKDIDMALDVLSNEAEILREPNKRYQAIRFQLLAACEYLSGNTEKAQKYLDKQWQIFETLGDSYKNIILHNKILLSSSHQKNKRIEFTHSTKFDKEIFYIDPRLW